MKKTILIKILQIILIYNFLKNKWTVKKISNNKFLFTKKKIIMRLMKLIKF